MLPEQPDKRGLYQGVHLYQVMMTWHFLNDIGNGPELTQKSINSSYLLV